MSSPVEGQRQTLLDHYEEMRAGLLAAIHGLTDEQMADPSLDGWSVADHLSHLACWDEIRAAEVTRISAGYDSAWRMSGGQDDTFNALAYDLRRGLSPAQALWELETTRQHLLDAIAGASERGLESSFYGEAGLVSGHEAEHAGWIQRWRTEKGI